MKKILMIIFALSLANLSFAAQSTSKKKKPSKNMSFDEILVEGQYYFSDEAVVSVESDKVLDGLIEVRKEFKDRLKRSARRY